MPQSNKSTSGSDNKYVTSDNSAADQQYVAAGAMFVVTILSAVAFLML